MKATEFCYWLQGYFEIAGEIPQLTKSQLEIVKNHLNLVFLHDIDPSQQAIAQAVHDGNSDTVWRC